jgi:hypothetical protein
MSAPCPLLLYPPSPSPSPSPSTSPSPCATPKKTEKIEERGQRGKGRRGSRGSARTSHAPQMEQTLLGKRNKKGKAVMCRRPVFIFPQLAPGTAAFHVMKASRFCSQATSTSSSSLDLKHIRLRGGDFRFTPSPALGQIRKSQIPSLCLVGLGAEGGPFPACLLPCLCACAVESISMRK